MSLRRFGILSDGSPVMEALLALPSGMTAAILDYGAVVRDLRAPTGSGPPRRVVLGYRDMTGYADDHAFLGAIVGRHANRIAGGRFELDGKSYRLTLNERGRTHLHGGTLGFSRKPWRIVEHGEASVALALISPAGEDGYPGTLEASCTYRLMPPATLAIELSAAADAPTIVNLAHHSYFTLDPGRPVRDHVLQVNAGRYTPTDADLIPTGEIQSVVDTPYDFRAPRPIASSAGGSHFIHDINFVLDHRGPGLCLAASVGAPGSPLRMEVCTTEPGLQFYDGGHLRPDHPDLDGRFHFSHAGLCLEPGLFPDGPNHPEFPSPVLRPGQVYRQRTEYRFLPAAI